MTIRPARYASLFLLIFLAAIPGRALAMNWGNGLSAMGSSLSDTGAALGSALMQQELQRQLLEEQHQQEMQELQAQHDLQVQQMQEQQRLFLEQQRQLQIDAMARQHQPAAAATSRAVNAAELAHLVRVYPNWRTIVGAPNGPGQKPDLTVPFRKWLATTDRAYQVKMNSTQSAREIESAIVLFQAQTGPANARNNGRSSGTR